MSFYLRKEDTQTLPPFWRERRRQDPEEPEPANHSPGQEKDPRVPVRACIRPSAWGRCGPVYALLPGVGCDFGEGRRDDAEDTDDERCRVR